MSEAISHAGPGEGHVRGRPAARARRRAGSRLQASARRGRRGRRRGQPDTMDFTFIAYDVDEDGNWVNERDDTPKKEELGRIAAQTFRQVMSQRIREVESRPQVRGVRQPRGRHRHRHHPADRRRYTLLDLGRVEALLPQAEQVPYERPTQGDRSKAYIVEVRKTPKGPQIVVSRTHPGLIKRCSSSRCPRSPTASSRSRPAPASPATAPRSRSGRTTTTSTRSAPASAPAAPRAHGRQRDARREDRHRAVQRGLADFVAKALSPAKVTQVIISEDGTQPTSSCPTTSSAWRSAARARTRASPPASPGCGSTSGPRPSSPRVCRPAAATPRSTTPTARGSPTPRPARWSGTPPTGSSSASRCGSNSRLPPLATRPRWPKPPRIGSRRTGRDRDDEAEPTSPTSESAEADDEPTSRGRAPRPRPTSREAGASRGAEAVADDAAEPTRRRPMRSRTLDATADDGAPMTKAATTEHEHEPDPFARVSAVAGARRGRRSSGSPASTAASSSSTGRVAGGARGCAATRRREARSTPTAWPRRSDDAASSERGGRRSAWSNDRRSNGWRDCGRR